MCVLAPGYVAEPFQHHATLGALPFIVFDTIKRRCARGPGDDDFQHHGQSQEGGRRLKMLLNFFSTMERETKEAHQRLPLTAFSTVDRATKVRARVW